LLIEVGNQDPTIPLGEDVFNIGTVPPEHKGPTVGKFGLTIGLTVTVMLTGVAETHCPLVGVKM
jgi:hypothetical protein